MHIHKYIANITPNKLIIKFDSYYLMVNFIKKNMPAIDRITSNPNIMNGKACIRGMRIPVSIVLNLLANGMN